MAVIKTEAVVGVGETQVLVVADIPITPPAFEIKEIQKTVIIEDCTPIEDKVIINGVLRKNINFKTFGEQHESHPHHMHKKVKRVTGDLRHVTVWIPFALFIEVPGAKEGDICQVERAEVVGQVEREQEVCPETGAFKVLQEKAVIRICVKVTRQVQVRVAALPVARSKVKVDP